MVSTEIPPVWTDRDDCFRCHTSFSAFTRKHHCRACGETFCWTCSSKQSSIHEYGIEDEVRVCEPCYDRLVTTGSVRRPAEPIATSNETRQAELDDDEDALQLALTLSQSEADEKERQKKVLTQRYATFTAPLSSAPIYEPTPSSYISHDGIDTFVHKVNEHINQMKFRMLSNQQRGRNISNDTAVQSAFALLEHIYPELHRFMRSLDDKQASYEGLQDKLGRLKDAREALNALREEHLETRQRQAVERERQRQLQLAVKLDDMRQKKQAYMEYQRQMHLQRLADQEAEMQARLDQQRFYTQQREQHNQMLYIPPSTGLYYHHPPFPVHTPVTPSTGSTPLPTEQTLISFD